MLSISEVLAIGRLQGAQQRLKKARRAGVKSVFLKAPVKGLRVFDVVFLVTRLGVDKKTEGSPKLCYRAGLFKTGAALGSSI
jgi:hypothetical protein